MDLKAAGLSALVVEDFNRLNQGPGAVRTTLELSLIHIFNYLNYYRVECAAELLCTTQGSITDIALECGFGDVSYFSRMFRRYKGQTPDVYKRQTLICLFTLSTVAE